MIKCLIQIFHLVLIINKGYYDDYKNLYKFEIPSNWELIYE